MPKENGVFWRGLKIDGYLLGGWLDNQQPVLVMLEGATLLPIFSTKDKMDEFFATVLPKGRRWQAKQICDGPTFLSSALAQVRVVLDPYQVGGRTRWTEVELNGEITPAMEKPNDDAARVIAEMKEAAFMRPITGPEGPDKIEVYSRKARFAGRDYNLTLTYMAPPDTPRAAWQLSIDRDVVLEEEEYIQIATAFLGEGWMMLELPPGMIDAGGRDYAAWFRSGKYRQFVKVVELGR